MASAIWTARGPLTRRSAMAPSPKGVEMAAMVSFTARDCRHGPASVEGSPASKQPESRPNRRPFSSPWASAFSPDSEHRSEWISARLSLRFSAWRLEFQEPLPDWTRRPLALARSLAPAGRGCVRNRRNRLHCRRHLRPCLGHLEIEDAHAPALDAIVAAAIARAEHDACPAFFSDRGRA